jgi:hypothetical protein
MRPEALRVSVKEGVFYARFAEGTPFSLDAVRDAVRRAGLTYRQTELVARGRLAEASPEAPALLLVDERVAMVLLLVEGEDPATFEDLRAALASGHLGDAVQIAGLVVETPDAEGRARAAGADLVVAVDEFAAVSEATLPPVHPNERPGGPTPSALARP